MQREGEAREEEISKKSDNGREKNETEEQSKQKRGGHRVNRESQRYTEVEKERRIIQKRKV